MVDHLVSKLGFSLERAIKASTSLSHLKSLEKLESFMASWDPTVSAMPSCPHQKNRILPTQYSRIQCGKDLCSKDSSIKGFKLFRVWSHPSYLLKSTGSCCQLQPHCPPKNPILAGPARLESSPHQAPQEKQLPYQQHREKSHAQSLLSLQLRHIGWKDRHGSPEAPWLIIQRRRALVVAAADRVEKEIGIAHSSGMFLWALQALKHASKKKIQCQYEAHEEFWVIGGRLPLCIRQGTDVLE